MFQTVPEFYFKRNGEYVRREPNDEFPIHLRRKKTSSDRNDLRGKVCPSCGITRSMSNKCDCNS